MRATTRVGTEPRILIFDLETSHNLLAKFDLREEWTPYQNIIIERHLFCAAWKWHGAKTTEAVSLLDDRKRFKADIHDDYHVVKTLQGVIADADALVAHNGAKFDIKWLAGRALKHGLPPLPPVPMIDTLQVARRSFLLNSNRLDYLGQYLGIGRKIETPQGLWLKALHGDKAAIREMVTYNKGDVDLLEAVFDKLRAYMPEHVNRHLFSKDGCPRCGSTKVQSRGFRYALTRKYRRFQCLACGGWWRASKPEKDAADARLL